MKKLLIFLSFITIIALGLFVNCHKVYSAPGDVEKTIDIGSGDYSYLRHMVRIGNYIYVASNKYTYPGGAVITKIDKDSGEIVDNFFSCGGGTGIKYDMETDGTYLYVNEQCQSYDGACNALCWSRPADMSSSGFTKMDPNTGQPLARIWFKSLSKASAYAGGYLWNVQYREICRSPTSGTDRADDCFEHPPYVFAGQISDSDGTHLYVHGQAPYWLGGDDSSHLMKIRHSDGALIDAVETYEYSYPMSSLYLRNNSEIWVMSWRSYPYHPYTFYKINTSDMTKSGPYSTVFGGYTGNNWGQHNISSEGDCIWICGETDYGEDTQKVIQVFNTSGTEVTKLNPDPEAGTWNKAYDLLYDPTDQKMWLTRQYTMRVYRMDASGCPSGQSANNPPNAPSNPSPANVATNVDINADLSWTGDDPDGDPVTFDVYFEAGDSSPDVLVSVDQGATTYDPGALTTGTTYYWQIVARDDKSAEASGPVWSFTTNAYPSGYLDNPIDGETILGTYQVSGWALDDGGVDHVEVVVDSVSKGNAVYGDSRADVCAVYPGYPNCPNVGFHWDWDSTTYSNGSHTIYVRAYDAQNLTWQSDTRTVTVANNIRPGRPTSLLTNDQSNPTGVVGVPYFSAIYHDPNPGDTANSYRLYVDDNSDFSSIHWNSGWQNMNNCAEGSKCQNITYSGAALQAGVTYFWRIKYRDVGGLNGIWSNETASFQMEESGAIEGTVWVDYDGDCVRDAGEDNYTVGATLYLKQSGITKYTFSSNGDTTGNNFALLGVLAGAYDLVVEVPSGFRLSTDNALEVIINVGQITTVNEVCL